MQHLIFTTTHVASVGVSYIPSFKSRGEVELSAMNSLTLITELSAASLVFSADLALIALAAVLLLQRCFVVCFSVLLQRSIISHYIAASACLLH